MKILFITGHKYLPQMTGGLQTCSQQFCSRLIEHGHQASVLAGLLPGGWLGFCTRVAIKFRKLLGKTPVARDTIMGYPVWRSWHPWEVVPFVIEREVPDLVVVLAIEPVRMALAAKPSGVPLLMQLMDVEFKDHGGAFEDLGNVACLANSRFTAQRYHEAYGVTPAVVYPFIDPEKYRTTSTQEFITFINPVVEKGRDVALAIARACPDLPFLFVEGWPLSTTQREELMSALARLPNVTLLPSQKDMRNVYGRTKILLVPSLWEEAYGRVATEAQLSGIPVVASNRGGLPEAVGTGGISLDPEGDMDAWVAAIRRLWQDDTYYQDISSAALAYASREEMRYEYQYTQMAEAMQKAIERLQITDK